MAKNQIDQALRARIDAFIDDISELVRAQAVEAVGEALGADTAGAPAKRGPGRPRKAATRSTAKRKSTAGSKGKRIRRSPEQLAKTQDKILTHIKANPGCRMEDMTAALGEDAYTLRGPLNQLKADKQIKTKGQKRATAYFVAGAGGAASKPAKAKRKTKKKGKKRTSTRTTGTKK